MRENGIQRTESNWGTKIRNRVAKFGGAVAKVTAEISVKAKEAVGNLVKKGIIVAYTVKERLRPFARKVKMRLGSVWQDILDYRTSADKEQDADCERYENTAAISVLTVLEGPDTIQTFCNLTTEAQKYVLTEIHKVDCQNIGIEPPEFAIVGELPPMTNGCYIYKDNLMLINSELFEQPMEYTRAQQLITVLLHENFHAFQACALLNPEKYNVPRNVAKLWRDNERNYIQFEQNPIAYRLQPQEAYAYRVSGNAMALLRNEEYVRTVEEALNQKGEF